MFTHPRSSVRSSVEGGVLSLLLLSGCATSRCHHETHHHAPGETPNAANQHMGHSDFPALIARFEDPARVAWQRPDALVAALHAEGKVVLDLGCGTGYFAVRLAQVAARVIAADIDERFLAYLRGRMSALPDGVRARIEPRKIESTSPGLAPEEADLALVVDVYHHIDDRVTYLRRLEAGLKRDGELVIVDFKPGDFGDAPPESLRVPSTQVVAELEAAGFVTPTVDLSLLPRQYIVRARARPGH